MVNSRSTKKQPVVAVIVILVFIATLAYVVFLTTNRPSKNQDLLKNSIEKIDALVDKNTTLTERYSLTFDDPILNQKRSIFEDFNGNVKIVTPNLITVRKDDGKNYLYAGRDTKNSFYDRFSVEKKHFDKRRKKAYAAVLINSYISRGITMYSGYSPRQFWKKLLTDLSLSKNLKLTENNNAYLFQVKPDKNTKIVLYLDKKTLLPAQLKLAMSSSKVWHDESTYKNLNLKVVARKLIKINSQSFFKIAIPTNYKSRDIIIKKREEEEHEIEDSNLDEAICDSCHYKDMKIKRFEKKSSF